LPQNEYEFPHKGATDSLIAVSDLRALSITAGMPPAASSAATVGCALGAQLTREVMRAI